MNQDEERNEQEGGVKQWKKQVGSSMNYGLQARITPQCLKKEVKKEAVCIKC